MILAMLAATTVAPLVVTPPRPAARADATIEVPYDDAGKGHWAAVWPEQAYRDGVGGRVVLSCDVDGHGLAEACTVVSETPPGKGFGLAALQLRPTFKLAPAVGPDGPIDATMAIAVAFLPPKPTIAWGGDRGGGPAAASVGPLSNGGGADGPKFSGPPPDRRSVSMLNNPVWAATPGYHDVVAAYPAMARGEEGYVVAHCRVRPGGALSACQVVKEDPAGRGFDRAALSLAAEFRVAPRWSTAPGRADVWVDIPLRFPAPGDRQARIVSRPYWLAGVDARRALEVFPKAAAAKGVSAGLGVAECRVARDGALTGCAPKQADPEGLGFSEAAVVLVSAMRMNPWLRDGEPADGAVVRVGLTLTLTSQP